MKFLLHHLDNLRLEHRSHNYSPDTIRTYLQPPEP